MGSGGVAVQEVVHEHGDVGAPLAQRRQMDRNHVQAEIEIFSKGAGTIGSFQVAIGCGDHANIHVDLVVAADRSHLFFLERPQ